MKRSFKRLKRVLDLEVKQGYRNKAVVGGIRQFANYWIDQARKEAADEADKALVEQIAEMLTEYGRLSGKEARAKAVDTLLTHINKYADRVGDKPAPADSSPAKSPAKDKKSAKSERKPAAKKSPQPRRSKWDKPKAPKEPVEPDPQGLSQPVTTIKGVGSKMAEKLARLGAETLWELLYVFPRRYDDYTLMKPIQRLQYGEQVTVIGTVWETRARRIRGNQTLVQSVISDGTARIQATWFNQPWLKDKLQAGMQIVLSGTVDQYLGRPVFNSPEWEPLEMEPLRTRRIVPIYPLTQGLHGNKMRDILRTAVYRWAPRVPEPLPADLRQRHNLFDLPDALLQIHFPDDQDALHKARRRIVFDELFLLQLGMQTQRRDWQAQPAMPILREPAHLVRFRNSLPFELTGAQNRVVNEIMDDMSRDVPMNRLLQGDVGAGKTVVAAAALMVAAKAGTQAALMAPTEILAEQHYQSLQKMLDPLEIEVRLLTGSTPAAEKADVYAALARGDVDVAVGTHALIQEAVNFSKLSLAIIDEQHRFGVDQRAALRDKGALSDGGHFTPHVLVMSATPIPRTLALSMYGDLDLSSLDEMPPGRQEIKTRWLQTRERERAYAFIRGQIQEGRQAYVIYPLVEESDKIDAKAAVAEYERLQNEVFPDLRLGLIHGRLKSDEKEGVMRAFYQGDIDILVSTSVIEVGVDVPNATVMLVDGANRFGLAQLHQFRGRVGRGEHQSFCILIADGDSAEAEQRLTALEQTNDGFQLAEKDLELRGPGEFFGRRQSGLPEIKMASLLDMEMLEITQKEAQKLFANDPQLSAPEHAQLRAQVNKFWETAADIS